MSLREGVRRVQNFPAHKQCSARKCLFCPTRSGMSLAGACFAFLQFSTGWAYMVSIDSEPEKSEKRKAPSRWGAHQLSAFPGPCPPVVRLPWTEPTSCPASLDPARQLSAFFVCLLFLPASCPPSLGPARQLSASPGPCPRVVRLPWTLPVVNLAFREHCVPVGLKNRSRTHLCQKLVGIQPNQTVLT